MHIPDLDLGIHTTYGLDLEQSYHSGITLSSPIEQDISKVGDTSSMNGDQSCVLLTDGNLPRSFSPFSMMYELSGTEDQWIVDTDTDGEWYCHYLNGLDASRRGDFREALVHFDKVGLRIAHRM